MLTRNVYYSEKPERVIIRANGRKAIVEFPIGVIEMSRGQGEETITEWLAEKVYSTATIATPNLKHRVEENYSSWLEKAKNG